MCHYKTITYACWICKMLTILPFYMYVIIISLQICEAYIAGFDFVVLDSAFLIHKGFKEKTENPPNKIKENWRNKQLFDSIQAELHSKYPESTRRCQ